MRYNVHYGFMFRSVESVDTVEEAWAVIDSLPIYDTFEVRDEAGEICEEFIPY